MEKSTCIPWKIHFTTKETINEDKTTINNLIGTVFYKHDSDEWYPQRIVYTMKIKTKVFPFYTFQGRIKNKAILSDYSLFTLH